MEVFERVFYSPEPLQFAFRGLLGFVVIAMTQFMAWGWELFMDPARAQLLHHPDSYTAQDMKWMRPLFLKVAKFIRILGFAIGGFMLCFTLLGTLAFILQYFNVIQPSGA